MAQACYDDCSASKIWLGDSHSQAVPAQKSRQILGSEYALAVMDMHSGLHPNALAALAGSVIGGGVLIMLIPPQSQWAELADPDYERLATYPLLWQQLPRRFIHHIQASLQRYIDAGEGFFCVAQQDDSRPVGAIHESPLRAIAPTASRAIALQPTSSQREVMRALMAHQGVSVLLAERGRGKSAALGFAAQQWLAAGRRVLLTAPSRQAAASVFRHAGTAENVLAFCAPDGILADEAIQADILLVDEAAAISLPMLLALVARFPCIVFASTTDGYEGTGQGFVLRFLRELDRRTPGWQPLTLDAPVRWAEGDALERWLYEALLLRAHEQVLASVVDAAPEVEVLSISQNALLENPALLQAVYGLLRSAHYRTTPDDLRFLLDGPALSIYLLQRGADVLAVALIVEEGSIDADMAGEIAAGRRRPRGHLLVQTLAVHLNQPMYLRERVARVVRIAVHTQWQSRGLGSRLLQAVMADQRVRGVHSIGSSFSATPEVLAFWQKNGFELLRLGHKRQASSAAPAALVLHGY